MVHIYKQITNNLKSYIMKTLDEKIAELIAETELKDFAAKNFGGLETTTYLYKGKKCINFNRVETKILEILEFFPPTENKTCYGNNDEVINSPFRIDINNPCQVYSSNYYSMNISYISGDYSIKICIPIELLLSFVTVIQRGVTDSEYHYFTGVSLNEIKRINLRKYSFLAKHQRWYGGNETLLNTSVIDQIINHIKTL